MELTHHLTPKLKQLRLSGMLATLASRERAAIDGQWPYVEFLERLLEDEVERRAQKQLALRVRRAALTSTKTLDSFDWAFNPTVNRQQVLQLASGDYLRQRHNVLICGPAGVGKTHLAHALAHEACRQGYAESSLAAAEAEPRALRQAIATVLADAPRPGAPDTFTAEPIVMIVNLACTPPPTADRPVTAWTPRELADEAVKQGIVTRISPQSVARFLKSGRAAAASQSLLAQRQDQSR